MRKKFLLKGLALSTILSSVMPAVSVFAAPPVYRSNELEEVMLTRIIPTSDPYMEFTYRRLGTRDETEKPGYSNIQYGEVSDYQLHMLGTGKYPNTTLIAKGHYNAIFGWPSFEDGETRALTASQMTYGTDLTKNTSRRLHFVVIYALEKQRSRVDYSRCVESDAFKSGLATECRMEYKANGLVQYQPYNSEGVRMELTPEEDARLTAATESWRAEPGAWGPEWYVEPEEPADGGESGGGGSEEGSGDGGGDGPGGETGGETGGSETGGESGGSESGGEPGSETGGSESGGEPGSETGDSENGDEAGNEGGNIENESSSNGGESSGSSDVVIAFSIENSSPSGGSSDGGSSDGGSSDAVLDSTGEVYGANLSGISGFVPESADNTGANESQNENNLNENGSNISAEIEDNVGVPSLGQEEESDPKWPAIFTISMVAAAGLAGWWFLFFGRRHLKERKENKE